MSNEVVLQEKVKLEECIYEFCSQCVDKPNCSPLERIHLDSLLVCKQKRKNYFRKIYLLFTGCLSSNYLKIPRFTQKEKFVLNFTCPSIFRVYQNNLVIRRKIFIQKIVVCYIILGSLGFLVLCILGKFNVHLSILSLLSITISVWLETRK